MSDEDGDSEGQDYENGGRGPPQLRHAASQSASQEMSV